MLSKYEIFRKPKLNSIAKLFATGMLAYEGEQWFKVRKIANPAFHQFKLKDMFPSMCWSCNEMISKWKILVSNQNQQELDVWPYIQTFTADVISRTAFGSSYEDGRKIFELMRQQIINLSESMQFSFIPGWRFLPTATNRRMRSNYNETRALIKGIIHKKEEAIKLGEASADDDLLGQETTSTLILWTMVLLCMHPRWQALAREEVVKVFGNDKPKFDDLNHLKVVTNILYEVLRLYPPAIILTRTVYSETKLGEINIPPGIELSIPLVMVHHDHEYWGDDADEFNPDRFSEGVLKASKNNEVSFFPFGGGPRICIGQNFALMEAKIAFVTNILYEALRLYPPATILTRTVYSETKLGEINIPPAIELSIPLVMVHHDHEYWGDDADEFNPDRFSEGVSKSSKNNEVSFFPFGGGPRICIGQNFALMEAKMAFVMILQNFSFELSPAYVHSPTSSIIIQPQNGAHLILPPFLCM
ncbi:hypothetical protein LWI28_023027 [Acer negundo]|uniref:Cytochrome P450 n=1 Tax=Acer negundo TaxID=4023 RepID=A0AAD5J6G4_ACENE|nr:hypothetical protein LWI28_023027 [Acer negundo]